jgi:hypothetical protein
VAEGKDPGGLGPFIKMEDPLAGDYIVRDISSERGLFRWAFLHPELQLRVDHAQHLRFTAEIAIPDATFKTTGPVTVSCSINGNALATIRCPRPAKYQIAKAVPAAWIDPGKPVHVTFDAQPRWVSPEDGAELSFLLYSAGFID